MASPQLENGHTRIANELIEAFARLSLSSSETKCIWVIIRKTYGWNKKSDAISLSQFSLYTGIKKHNVCKVLAKLTNRKIIIKRDNSYVTKYSINKNFEQWEGLSKQIVVSKQITKVIQTDTESSIQTDNHKRKKETIQKKDFFNKNYAKKNARYEDPPWIVAERKRLWQTED